MSKFLDLRIDGAGDLIWTQNDVEVARMDSSANVTMKGTVNGGSIPVTPTGADPTGAADSTAALQAWLTTWAAVGGDAALPPGTYKVTTMLTYTGSLNARLHAHGATIKVGATFPVGGSPAWAMIRWNGSNVRVYGLTVDGSGLANRGMTVAASNSHVSFMDCEFKSFAQQALETDVNCVGLRIEGACHDISVDRCYFHDIVAGANNLASFARGVLISDPSSVGVTTNVKIKGCTFTDITWTGTLATDADAICIQDWSTNASLLVDSCYFTNIFKRAVKIQTPGVTVTNCTIENTYLGTGGVVIAGSTDPQVYSGISIYANDCVIANNNLLGGSWFQGIEIGTAATAVNRVTVANNRVIGGTSATMTGSAGIRVYGNNTCGDFVITGNYVKRFTKGIWLSTAAVGVNVSSNQIQGDSVASSIGVYVDGQSSVYPTRLTATGNNMEGLTRYGFELAGGTDFVITGNQSGRAGFEVIQPTAFASITRLYAWNNSGSGSTTVDDRNHKSRPEILLAGQGIVAEAFPRILINAALAPATQQIYAMAVGLKAGDIVTNCLADLQTLGVGTAPTLIKMALLDKTGKVLAASADTSASAIWTSGLGPKTVALSSAYTVTLDDLYYVAFLKNGVFGTTDISLARIAGSFANQISPVGAGVAPFGAQATQTDFQAVNSSQTLTLIGTSYLWLGAS